MLDAGAKLIRLDPSRRGYLLAAAGALLLARLEHAVRSTKAILDDLQAEGAPDRVNPVPAQRLDPDLVAWAIETAARHVPWRSDCLLQVMAATRWLRRHGHSPEFHLGVARDGAGQMQAHAWLTLGGAPFLGTPGVAGPAFVSILAPPFGEPDGAGPAPRR